MRTRQEGQAMVEFVLVAPLLLLLIFGLVQFGILFNNYVTLTDAVRAGARQAAVSRSLPNPETVAANRVKSSAGNMTITDVSVDPYDPSDGSRSWVQGGDVTVTAHYPYEINIFGFTVKSGNLTSQTTERVE
jgi:Flp pilus assembly protein TadG